MRKPPRTVKQRIELFQRVGNHALQCLRLRSRSFPPLPFSRSLSASHPLYPPSLLRSKKYAGKAIGKHVFMRSDEVSDGAAVPLVREPL